MPIKNLIITGANTAREINPYGERPHENCVQNHQLDNYFKEVSAKRWQEAESSLKEYRITPNPEECKAFEAIEEKVGGKITHLNYGTKLPIGTKVECETNEELLTFYIL